MAVGPRVGVAGESETADPVQVVMAAEIILPFKTFDENFFVRPRRARAGMLT